MFMTYQPKKDKEKRNMDSEREWKLHQEELFLKEEDKKVEKN